MKNRISRKAETHMRNFLIEFMSDDTDDIMCQYLLEKERNTKKVKIFNKIKQKIKKQKVAIGNPITELPPVEQVEILLKEDLVKYEPPNYKPNFIVIPEQEILVKDAIEDFVNYLKFTVLAISNLAIESIKEISSKEG